MSAITTHILDTSLGRPAAGVRVELHEKSEEGWKPVGESRTDASGRCNDLTGDELTESGTYRLLFHTASYFQ
jgi:5-hydroxyisourate hydrolase